MIKINSQQDLDALLALLNWEDAFLREWYMLSPSYINPYKQEIIAPDSAPMMFILICTLDSTYPCIELFFEEVEEIYFSCRNDLNPVASYQNDRILFSFHGDESSDIQSKFLYYRILGNDDLGWKVRYGKKNIFDSSGFLISEDL
jgi:hypothetical protein